ncbi:hypothetical protein Tco_0445161 [Tanacetum coccineum]
MFGVHTNKGALVLGFVSNKGVVGLLVLPTKCVEFGGINHKVASGCGNSMGGLSFALTKKGLRLAVNQEKGCGGFIAIRGVCFRGWQPEGVFVLSLARAVGTAGGVCVGLGVQPREELDSAYERFQHILSMLELHDATVSIEDANLKFLRSLLSVWHVVATMIRGQPGLDELDFDDLYNNLKVYEHELKGVSNSNSQNIAFLSTEVKGSTLKQSTAEPAHIPKGYTQAISSKVPTAPNCVSHSDEIICSFFAQQASMPTTHDDEDCCKLMKMAMERN